jgi:hypothetical protein
MPSQKVKVAERVLLPRWRLGLHDSLDPPEIEDTPAAACVRFASGK